MRENLHLVRINASKMKRTNRHVDHDDLVQDGWFGLREAARNFDPARGVKFLSFAGRRIWGAMLDGLRDRDHVSRNMRSRGEAPNLQSFATKLFESDAGRVRNLGDTLVDQRSSADIDAFDGRDHFARLLTDLTRSERLVIELYYAADMTMKEIGRVLDLSESRVSQMHGNLIAQLRARLTRSNSRKDA